MTSDEKLPRSRRITHRQDFLRIQSTGRRCRSAHFLLATLPRVNAAAPQDARHVSDTLLPEHDDARIGITITTKVDKRAARRNRLRRRIREIFRRERARLLSGRDLVIIALTGATELEFVSVEDEVRTLLRRARLYRRN